MVEATPASKILVAHDFAIGDLQTEREDLFRRAYALVKDCGWPVSTLLPTFPTLCAQIFF